MTPKEKAKELYESYLYSIPTFTDEGSIEHNTAKQCALIAVDEILKLTPINNKLKLIDYSYINFKYWHEVKQEIENI